jgi:lipooligosaccharide transport system permease protein
LSCCHQAAIASHLAGQRFGRFLSPLLFLLSMGIGLGSLVDKSAGGVGEVPYLQFVVPGILAANRSLAL